MIKYYSQMLVLIGVCMASGQGINKELNDHSGKDSAVVIPSTAAVSQGGISIKYTAIIAPGKDTSCVALKDTSASVTPKDTSASVTPKDTSASVTPKDTSASVTPKDTSAVVSGDQSKPDSVKKLSNSIVLDTTKSAVSEPAIPAVLAIPEKNEEIKQVSGGRCGIGINLLLKVFNSKEINNFLEDVYDKWHDDILGPITKEAVFSPMKFMGGVNLKGIIYVSPVVGLEPFGFVSFSKSKYIVRNVDHEVDIRLVDAGGGINIWARVAPKKCVSFKAGLGGYVCGTTLNVDGYAGQVELNGMGYGINILAGIDITLRKMAVNIDFLLPVGSTELVQDGTLNKTGSSKTIRYPSEFVHNGFVIRPGVTFLF